MDIGKIIKEERTKRNLTQEQLAQEFFVTRQLISKWENGKSYPDLDQVVKLSSYFELTLDYLLKEDQQMVQELNLTTHRKQLVSHFLSKMKATSSLLQKNWRNCPLNKDSCQSKQKPPNRFDLVVFVNFLILARSLRSPPRRC